ncbi:flagellar basal body rod protein FlgF [Candidatus Symbiobacter mobilis]|uniref:Flagellar basal-body rod protein FlgF n=1 Tax=Candidatus Symbiobacter mobilis CR TaxID=946483 RepID=U5NB68_9BURK|nr:flagellar basal body rod protein FlgF [Candidatus Symbiobacter mobilis]AGX87409.1 flagellar basal body rod protein FlgF [Candidatus Symbiobacter mobilis CR]
MDRIIYTAMTGANAAAHRQALLSNNLANVSTNGFRAELSTYRSVPVRGTGSTTRVMALDATPGFLDLPGTPHRTGRAMDAMIMGNSWFAVQGLDGTEAYTRNGAFEVSLDGTVLTNTGLTVLGDGGAPITAPQGAEVTLGVDGTVTAQVPGQPAAVVGRLKIATPTPEDPLKRGDDGLFRTTSGDPLANDATVRIQPGTIEGSNVNVIETMVSMIQSARQFDAQTRLMQTAEASDRAAAQLLNMQG